MTAKSTRQSNHGLKVRRSKTGLGLFTKTPIKKDEFVVEYFGPIITRNKADQRGGKYLFEINRNWVIEGSSRKNIARYINHSCKPNCEIEVRGKRIYIHAKRRIKPNEELGYNYGREYFDDLIKPRGCRCVACVSKC